MLLNPQAETRGAENACFGVLTLLAVVSLACSGPSRAVAQSIDELLQQQKTQQERRIHRIVELKAPLVACVKKHAHELYSNSEGADIAARAAVGLCSKEEAAYRSALFQLAVIMTSFDAAAIAQRAHDSLVEAAITIIVSERQRQRAAQEEISH